MSLSRLASFLQYLGGRIAASRLGECWQRWEKDAVEAARAEKEKDYIALEGIDAHTARLWKMLIGSCVGLLAWAIVFPLDVVSVAEGTVEPSARLQKVQHLEGGIVRELLIKEGEKVEKGQELVRLEPTQSNADYGEVDARLTALKADQLRLEAESAGTRTFRMPKDFARLHADVATRAEKLFAARRETLQANLAAHERAIAEISARLKHARASHQLAVEQVAIGNKLLAQELSNRYEQIDREKEENALLSRIREDEQAIGKAQSEMAAVRNKFDEDVRKELSDVRRQIEEMSNRGDKFRDQLTRTGLRAPMTGVVKQLYVNNIGAVVPAGGTVLDLVPGDGQIIVESKLPPQDVGFVRVGQKAFVQLASAEATRYGRIEGKVVHVSPDSVINKDSPAGQGLPVYYIVRVAADQDHFGDRDMRYDLTPGVQVTAGIVTGSRTVLTYLLYPIFRTMPFAMTER